ncbi:MAG: GTPase Era [Flavobacteriales bacterium]|nr:MAG: GTPase Era [Flavobacteriales bacterium]
MHKSGFVNIIGNPNVGKSTLMNVLVGERLSIITKKAQTTRHRILGIVNDDNYQIIFSDTPGIIQPAYELQESMMDFVKSAFEDADVLIYIVEVGEKQLKDERFFNKLKNTDIPVVVLLNKIDLKDQDFVKEQMDFWHLELPQATVIPISALEKFNIEKVFNTIVELLPEGPAFYPKDQLTDKTERFFVNETIREKILIHYKKEVPYAVEVDTESFVEEENIIRIRSVIMVERDSQKGILIGHQGKGLKRVGTEARKDLERFFQKKVFLELYVKVNKDWRKNQRELRRFGYKD